MVFPFLLAQRDNGADRNDVPIGLRQNLCGRGRAYARGVGFRFGSTDFTGAYRRFQPSVFATVPAAVLDCRFEIVSRVGYPTVTFCELVVFLHPVALCEYFRGVVHFWVVPFVSLQSTVSPLTGTYAGVLPVTMTSAKPTCAKVPGTSSIGQFGDLFQRPPPVVYGTSAKTNGGQFGYSVPLLWH